MTLANIADNIIKKSAFIADLFFFILELLKELKTMNAMQLTKEDGTRFFVTINSISAIEEVKTRKGIYCLMVVGNTSTMVIEPYDYILNKMFGIKQMSSTPVTL